MLKDGYAVVPGVFDANELAVVAADIERMPPARTRAGVRHLMSSPRVAELARDERLLCIAREWLGAGATPFRATLFDKSPDANWLVAWHQDTALPIASRADRPGWGPWSRKAGVLYAHAPASALEQVVALRIHIDDSDESNGPLRVLPGTHERGVMTDAQVIDCSHAIPALTCCVGAGGVVLMRPLIVHASSKAVSSRARRVLHVEYAASLVTGDGMTLQAA